MPPFPWWRRTTRKPSSGWWVTVHGERPSVDWPRISLPPRRMRLAGQLDLAPILQQSSLLALSSTAEGLPNVVLEAMAAGLPVVATDVGGLSEVVKHGETGSLVAPKDVAALANAISHLLADDTLRAAFGQAGRRRVERRFSVAANLRDG